MLSGIVTGHLFSHRWQHICEDSLCSGLSSHGGGGRRASSSSQMAGLGSCVLPSLSLYAGCKGSCHHICIQGRKEEERAARSPFIGKGAAFLGPPHRLHLCLTRSVHKVISGCRGVWEGGLGMGVGLVNHVRCVPGAHSTDPFPELGKFGVTVPSAFIISNNT